MRSLIHGTKSAERLVAASTALRELLERDVSTLRAENKGRVEADWSVEVGSVEMVPQDGKGRENMCDGTCDNPERDVQKGEGSSHAGHHR